MGSCPARQTKRNFDTRLFGFEKYSHLFNKYSKNVEHSFQQIGFQTCGRFMIFVCSCFEKCFVPKVPQKCPGGLWDHPRPIPDRFGPILEQNHLTNNYIEIRIKIPHSYPLMGAVM